MNRALNWLPGLAGGQALPGYPASLRVIDGELDNRLARFIAVVPDADNPFPRARSGEVGLLEGWGLAKAVSEAVEADRQGQKRAIVAVIDVPSQAYGRREEALGIHQALAAAVQAYAQARLVGHPVIGLLVGNAMSGAFLAHGYQAQRLIALDDAGVMVHAMGKAAAARITLRSVEQLEALAAEVPPMAYDLASYASLGLLWRRLTVDNAETPSSADIAQVRACLADAVRDIGSSSDLSSRLAGENRSASRQVREQLRRQWQGAPSIVSILMRTGTVGNEVQRRQARAQSTVLFAPPMPGIGLRSWRDFDSAVEQGYRHALDVIEQGGLDFMWTIRGHGSA